MYGPCCSVNSKWEVGACLCVPKYHQTSRERCLISSHLLSSGVGAGKGPMCSTPRILSSNIQNLYSLSFLVPFMSFWWQNMPTQFYRICPLRQTDRIPFVPGSLAFGVFVLSLIVVVQTPSFVFGWWGGASWWSGKLEKAFLNWYFTWAYYTLKSRCIPNLVNTL